MAGAAGYMRADSEFALNGIRAYMWVAINLVMVVFDLTYGKYLVSGVQFDNPVWGTMLYSNTLTVVPLVGVGAMVGEFAVLPTLHPDMHGLVWLAVSCAIGTGISCAGWSARSKVSATTFTLLGLVCKFCTIIINVFLWDKHATQTGLAMLTGCLISSTLYQQAPLRAEEQDASITDEPVPTCVVSPELANEDASVCSGEKETFLIAEPVPTCVGSPDLPDEEA